MLIYIDELRPVYSRQTYIIVPLGITSGTGLKTKGKYLEKYSSGQYR
jgi:hypothetical protein